VVAERKKRRRSNVAKGEKIALEILSEWEGGISGWEAGWPDEFVKKIAHIIALPIVVNINA
jgi:hypothetical protein